jgi:acetyltransferase-like isoleucine patch superfamily enzyme
MNHLPMRLLRLADRIRTGLFTTMIRNGFRYFGKRSVIRPPASLHGTGRIEIGNDVCIGRNAWLLAHEEGPSRADTVLLIGDGCRFGDGLFLSACAQVRIGNRVLAGRYLHISDHQHAHADPGLAVMDQGITGARAVTIGDGSWIGQGVVVCPGVSIGEHAVIGANSVVRSDIPARSVAAGAPAKVIRTLQPTHPC